MMINLCLKNKQKHTHTIIISGPAATLLAVANPPTNMKRKGGKERKRKGRRKGKGVVEERGEKERNYR